MHEILFKKDHPVFEGHFPDRPIVPAALLLNEIDRYFLLTNRESSVKQFSKVRFVRPLLPGQAGALHLSRLENTACRFEVAIEDSIICKGIIQTSTKPVPTPDTTSVGASVTQLAEHLYEKLPHQGAMALIDKVLDWSDHSILCEVKTDNSPIHDDRYSGQWVALEYAAQALACHGVLTGGQKLIRRASIVTVKEIFCGQNLPTEQILVSVSSVQTDAASCEFFALAGSEVIYSGRFNVAFTS